MFNGFNKISKAFYGNSELKKIYKGTNLLWEFEPEPYTFDFSKQNIEDVPSYIEYDGLFRETDATAGNTFSNGWYHVNGQFLRTLNTSSTYSYKNGYVKIKKKGRYKISVLYDIPERYGTGTSPRFRVYDGIKIISTGTILSSNLKIDKNAGQVHGVETYIADVNTDDFYINFHSYNNYQSAPNKNYFVYIYYIKIEPIKDGGI